MSSVMCPSFRKDDQSKIMRCAIFSWRKDACAKTFLQGLWRIAHHAEQLAEKNDTMEMRTKRCFKTKICSTIVGRLIYAENKRHKQQKDSEKFNTLETGKFRCTSDSAMATSFRANQSGRSSRVGQWELTRWRVRQYAGI